MTEESNILAQMGEDEKILLKHKKKKEGFITKKNEFLNKVAQVAESIDHLQSKKKDTQKSIDTINLSVEEHEVKLKELEEKRTYILTGGGKNADLEIIKERIEEENADRSALEDEIYALWEKIEKVESEIEQNRADLDRIKEEADEKAREIDSEISIIDDNITEINERIDKRLEHLKHENADASTFYERLRAKQIVPSAVPLRGSACSGCSCNLPPDVQNKVIEGQMVNCPLCNRFLYYIEQNGEEEGSPEKDSVSEE